MLRVEADISVVTTGKIMTMEELSNVQGRAWEDVDVSATTPFKSWDPYTDLRQH